MRVKFWKRFAAAMSDSLLGGVTLAAGDGKPGNEGAGADGGNTGGGAAGAEGNTGGAGASTGSGDFDPGLFQAVGLEPEVDFNAEGKILNKFGSVKELIKGYQEASTKLHERSPAAPESYTFDFSGHDQLKDVFKADSLKDDGLWKAFEPTFKKLGITNEQAQGLMETNLLWQLENVPDIAAEEKRLGADAKTILADIQAQAPKIAKTQDDINALEHIGRNADAVRLLHKVLQLTGEQGIPGAGTGVVFNANDKDALLEQANKIRNEKMFDADPQLQDRYLELMTKVSQMK